MKPLSEYDKKSAASDGRCSSCSECESKKRKAYWLANKEALTKRRKSYLREYWRKPENIRRSLERQKVRNAASPWTSLRMSLHNALNRRPTDNPATVSQLMEMFTAQGGKCALSGIAMTWGKGKIAPTSMSIDRVDSDRGYSLDNVRLVCHAVNTFRGRMSDDEMLVMAIGIVANAKPKLRLVS